MNQCVAGWDLDENPALPRLSIRSHSNSSTSVPTTSLDYEVAELTWENGQLATHGLGLPRMVNNKSTVMPTWDKPSSGGGTLESIVNQATHSHHKSTTNACPDRSHQLVPWFNHHRAMVNHPTVSGSLTVTMDALVPCNKNIININENLHVLDSVPAVGYSTGVGSYNPAGIDGRVTRVEMSGCKTNASMSESATCGGRESHQVTLDTCELGGFAPTSPEYSSGNEYSKTSTNDSVCHSRSQMKLGGDDGKRKLLGIGKSSISTKRSTAAAIHHNQSERKRRDKINQRMKTLQKMVPNSNKTDKASMLEEVIEYLKQLQAQIQMMSRMSMPSMMLPLAMQQQLQMSMMGMGMGVGVMDMNNIYRATGMPPVMPSTALFMQVPSWDNQDDRTLPAATSASDPLSAFLAYQSQAMTMDAYSRLASIYQQFQQNQGPGPKH